MANGDCVHPPQKGAEGFEECGSTEESQGGQGIML